MDLRLRSEPLFAKETAGFSYKGNYNNKNTNLKNSTNVKLHRYDVLDKQKKNGNIFKYRHKEGDSHTLS